MTFRLRHRQSYDPLSITHCLSLKAPRLKTPSLWHWTWPLHATSPSNSASSFTATASASSPVRHVWVSAIRAVAVSDDAAYVAFISQHGAVALSRPTTNLSPTTVTAAPHHFPDAASMEWCRAATAVTFFEITPSPSSKSRSILAVGYASGAIALFDPATVRLLAVSKLPDSAPIRHLRYYPAFHYFHQCEKKKRSQNRPDDSNDHNETHPPYSGATPNSGLFAVVGWAGTVAQLPADQLLLLILRSVAVADPHATGWLLWNLSSQDAVLDAAVCGSTPSHVYDVEGDIDVSTTQLRIVTVGVNGPIVAHDASPIPPFSARAAAARVATSFMSAARGFLLSRLSTEPTAATDTPVGTKDNSQREAVTGASTFSAAWIDDPDAYASLFKLPDSRASSARKALFTSFDASLQRRPPRSSALNNGHTLQKKTTALRSSSAPHASGTGSSSPAARLSAVANLVTGSGKRQSAYSNNMSSAPSINHKRSSMTDADIVRRVHSSMAREDVAVLLARYTKNMRVVERVVSAPFPSSLLASCDTLGRIFIQDPRDFCVLRVLKGYRDATVAWLMSDNSPILVVHAPRLDIVELHGPLEQKRREAFRVLPGTMLVQSTSYRPFCVFPDGRIFEFCSIEPSPTKTVATYNHSVDDARVRNYKNSGDNEKKGVYSDNIQINPRKALLSTTDGQGQEPSYELTGAFIEAVKSGRASHAVECLEKVANDLYKVAHLMATLIACASHTRVDVHMALASKAGQLAAELQNPDLVCRFEAHRRLAEAFQLVEAEPMLVITSADQLRASSRNGPRLIEDELGSGLAELSMEELNSGSQMAQVSGHRMTSDRGEGGGQDGTASLTNDDSVSCEQFILSHSLVPTVDLEVDTEFEILPRPDLSERECIWLATAYFGKLLELDSTIVPVAGREHPSTAELFAALAHFVGLSEAEITRQFVTFFLHAPLIPLLNTYVAMHASALQCTIARIRSRFTRDVVDPIVLDACETTTHVANAVLLVRLCATHGEHDYESESNNNWTSSTENDLSEVRSSSERRSANPYIEALDRLNEALAFQRFVIGSAVPRTRRAYFTARQFSGARGEAEISAVTELLAVHEYTRVAAIFDNRTSSVRPFTELKLQEAADVSIVALDICRKHTAALITDVHNSIIPPNVLSWIRSTESDSNLVSSNTTSSLNSEERLRRFANIRIVLIAALAFIPDSSVDAVRSLQLAEAISAVLEMETRNMSLEKCETTQSDSIKANEYNNSDDEDDDNDYEDANEMVDEETDQMDLDESKEDVIAIDNDDQGKE